jgi:hypothetical protein
MFGSGSVVNQDPGSGAFFTPGSGIQDGKNPDPGMNNLEHISESLETILWVKNNEIL